ncbi:hypothetical protein [Kineococcus radiotolerans]|uniref:hypothetical protein n=1 Tax=Kineococcus radiotolerans TaxID=131568 RepID=UPI0003223FB9|nr:hypothetical protein [Kineococcus radiotolerans]
MSIGEICQFCDQPGQPMESMCRHEHPATPVLCSKHQGMFDSEDLACSICLRDVLDVHQHYCVLIPARLISPQGRPV